MDLLTQGASSYESGGAMGKTSGAPPPPPNIRGGGGAQPSRGGSAAFMKDLSSDRREGASMRDDPPPLMRDQPPGRRDARSPSNSRDSYNRGATQPSNRYVECLSGLQSRSWPFLG